MKKFIVFREQDPTKCTRNLSPIKMHESDDKSNALLMRDIYSSDCPDKIFSVYMKIEK